MSDWPAKEKLARSRARELAASGEFADHQAIEFHLRFVEGVEARGALDDRLLRRELDAVCTQAKHPQSSASSA